MDSLVTAALSGLSPQYAISRLPSTVAPGYPGKLLLPASMPIRGVCCKTARAFWKSNSNLQINLRNKPRSTTIVGAKNDNPPIIPAIRTPEGPLDIFSVLYRNRTIFIGTPINSQVAQKVISQLITLATIDENADILMYLNCPGGSISSVLAIYDCMSWIKPKVGTVCFGITASHAVVLLAGGEKGMRYSMPNSRIMVNQPQVACEGVEHKVRSQMKEALYSRQKIDKMYAALTGLPLDIIHMYTDRDRFMCPYEAMEAGFIDGVLETEY